MQFVSPMPVQNYITHETFVMSPADARFPVSSEHIEQMVAVCNQDQVYQMLFAKHLQGKPYTQEDGERFLKWAKRGWQEQTHFVFLLLYPASNTSIIAGAVDIKSADLASAEIGYWLSAHCSGLMTNAVKHLVHIGMTNGYKELFARVRVDNPKSMGVLERAGFAITNNLVSDGIDYRRFAISP